MSTPAEVWSYRTLIVNLAQRDLKARYKRSLLGWLWSLINNDPRGFVKIISDPATGVILGGSIVGRQAAELIAVLAVAVTNGLRVNDIAECIFVHPALSEALTDAAE